MLLFIAFAVKAQTPKTIDSFLGVKFGSTSQEVIAGLKLKGAVLDKENSSANILAFSNVSLAGRKTNFMVVSFVDNKAYQAGLAFTEELEAKTIDYYQDLVSDLNKVYGQGNSKREFKAPYEDGDGSELTAIQTGYADYNTYWGLTDAEQPGIVKVKITDKMQIALFYVDKKLMSLASKKTEDANKAEY